MNESATRYSTLNELLDREVFAALGEYVGDFDLEAITTHLVEHDYVPYDQASQTFHLAIADDEFWAVMFRYDMTGMFVEVMAIDAETGAETDSTSADYFIIADVQRGKDLAYVDHECRPERYATEEEARAALAKN